jgi:hypothetical protein
MPRRPYPTDAHHPLIALSLAGTLGATMPTLTLKKKTAALRNARTTLEQATTTITAGREDAQEAVKKAKKKLSNAWYLRAFIVSSLAGRNPPWSAAAAFTSVLAAIAHVQKASRMGQPAPSK